MESVVSAPIPSFISSSISLKILYLSRFFGAPVFPYTPFIHRIISHWPTIFNRNNARPKVASLFAHFRISVSRMDCSNSLCLISFFVPTNNTNGQLGVRNSLSIRFIPMLLYAADSLTVRASFCELARDS